MSPEECRFQPKSTIMVFSGFCVDRPPLGQFLHVEVIRPKGTKIGEGVWIAHARASRFVDCFDLTRGCTEDHSMSWTEYAWCPWSSVFVFGSVGGSCSPQSDGAAGFMPRVGPRGRDIPYTIAKGRLNEK